MKIGFFGGSFDPPHAGHVVPVKAARRHFGLERVLFLPTAVPPHKPDRSLAPAFARYTMVELALLAEEGLYASSHELTPGRQAYTIETLEHFRRELPDDELYLLVGADSLAHFHTWRRFWEIPELAHLLVLARPGWGEERLRAEVAPEVLALLSAGRATLFAGPTIDASSTRIRQALAGGETLAVGILTPLVLDYVTKYCLYR